MYRKGQPLSFNKKHFYQYRKLHISAVTKHTAYVIILTKKGLLCKVSIFTYCLLLCLSELDIWLIFVLRSSVTFPSSLAAPAKVKKMLEQKKLSSSQKPSSLSQLLVDLGKFRSGRIVHGLKLWSYLCRNHGIK